MTKIQFASSMKEGFMYNLFKVLSSFFLAYAWVYCTMSVTLTMRKRFITHSNFALTCYFGINFLLYSAKLKKVIV